MLWDWTIRIESISCTSEKTPRKGTRKSSAETEPTNAFNTTKRRNKITYAAIFNAAKRCFSSGCKLVSTNLSMKDDSSARTSLLSISCAISAPTPIVNIRNSNYARKTSEIQVFFEKCLKIETFRLPNGIIFFNYSKCRIFDI